MTVNGIVNAVQVAGTAPVSQVGPVGKIEEAAEEKSAERRAAPRMDEYVPEETRTPIGLYRPEMDENGEAKIVFDVPEDEPRAPEGDKESPQAPKRTGGKEKSETCTGNTDKVDREIKKLRQERDKLEREISRAEDDPDRRAELEKQLAQVENELRMKDNDTYRRQHSEFN